MQNIKATTLSALQTATALSTLQGEKVYFFHPPDFTDLPVASYFEVDNAGSLYADDQEIGSEITWQIDLWGNSSLSTLALSVDTIMIGQGWTRVNAQDMYEQDTRIYRKMMRYRIDYSDPNF